MAGVYVKVRLGDEDMELLTAYADAKCNGNLSGAMRELMRKGLDEKAREDSLETAIENTIDKKLSDLKEDLAEAYGRSARASLGSLALSSQTLVAICEALKFMELDIHNILRRYALNPSQEDGAAFTRVEKLFYKHPAQVFNWAWDVGGRLQRQEGDLNITEAEKDMKYRYPGMPEEE